MPIPENKTLENLLNFTALKQKVIGQNIANAETIGYKRREVEFKDLLIDGMKQIPNSNQKESELNIKIDQNAENLSGVNNVDVNREMADMAENSVMFKFGAKKLILITKHYKKLLEEVINGNQTRFFIL